MKQAFGIVSIWAAGLATPVALLVWTVLDRRNSGIAGILFVFSLLTIFIVGDAVARLMNRKNRVR